VRVLCWLLLRTDRKQSVSAVINYIVVVTTRWDNEYESRRFTLGFTYNFGNTKMKAARDRKTGSSAEEGRM